VLEDFHSQIGKGEDPLEVLKSSSKIILGILPYFAVVILIFVSMSLASEPSNKQYTEAKVWEGECQRYFRFRAPSILLYRDYAPTVWCSVEAQKILREIIPWDYLKDTR
jgi:hypothetical protein